MLNFFRRGGTGQIVIGAVVFAIIIVFVLEFRPGREGAARLSMECAVEVHDACVDRKDFIASYQLIVPRGMTSKRVKEMNLHQHIQEGLVERELLVREAGRLGVSIGEEELDDELASGRAHISLPMANAQYLAYSLQLDEDWIRYLPVKSSKTEQFDYKIYERVVKNTTNRSPKEFKEMQKAELIAARMRDLVRSRVRVSESEAWLQFQRERSTAVARVASIPRDWFAKWVVDLSDAATDKWIAENEKQVEEAYKTAKESFTPGCPLVSEILVPFAADASEETKVDKRAEIDKALARLKTESFETVAKTASANASAIVGGEIGCVGENYGPGHKELTDALKGMKPGSVSPVVESAKGFHLLKLHGKLDAANLDKVAKRIVARKLMARFRADELAKEFAGELVKRTKNKTKLDEDLVKELALEYALRGPIKSKTKPKPPPAPKPKAPGTSAEEPADEASEPASHPALADDSRPKVEVTAPFPVMGSPVPNALPDERPALKLFELTPDQTLEKPVATDDGLAVVQLKEKTVAKKDEFEKNKADALRALRETKGREALMRYIAALRTESKDKIKLDAEIAKEQSGEGEG